MAEIFIALLILCLLLIGGFCLFLWNRIESHLKSHHPSTYTRLKLNSSLIGGADTEEMESIREKEFLKNGYTKLNDKTLSSLIIQYKFWVTALLLIFIGL